MIITIIGWCLLAGLVYVGILYLILKIGSNLYETAKKDKTNSKLTINLKEEEKWMKK